MKVGRCLSAEPAFGHKLEFDLLLPSSDGSCWQPTGTIFRYILRLSFPLLVLCRRGADQVRLKHNHQR